MSNENTLKLIAAIQSGQLNGTKPEDCGKFAPTLAEAVNTFEQTSSVEAAMRVVSANAELSELAAGGLKPKRVFKRLSAADLMNEPDPDWLFTGLLQTKCLAMIFGEPGAGKTFITLDLLYCAANKETFAGQFEPTRKMNVLYCTDEGVGGLKKTASRYCQQVRIKAG